MSFSSSSFYLTNTQHSVSRQVHPLPLEGLGEAPPQGLASHHIPLLPLTSPPSEGLGEAASFGCVLRYFCKFLSLSFFNLRPFAF